MAPDPSVGGYFLYLLEIFLPGWGFGELFQIWKKEDTLLERVGLAFGFGLSINTVVLMVKTSNVVHLSGISVYVLYSIMLAGAIAFGAAILVRRPKLGVPKLTRIDLGLILLLFIQTAMLVLYFSKYPIFPEYQSQDYAIHVQLAEGLISGSVTSIPSGILYYGIHFQLASGILLAGGAPLVTARQTMAILVVLSSLLFYSATKRIFLNTRAALICATIYVLSGTIWFASVFDSGLFANFYGILAALFLLIAFVAVTNDPRSPSAWIVFLIAVVDAYFSHYTLLTILPAILLVPVLHFLFAEKKDLSSIVDSLAPALVIVLPAIVPLIFFPSLGARILYLASSGGGQLSGSTILSGVLSPFPVLSYLALEIFDDIALIVLLFLTILYLYQIVKTRNQIFFIPIVWFLSLLIAAPDNVSAWRFSYEAIVPLTLMASFGLYLILPSFGSQSGRRSSMAQRTRSGQQGSILPRLFLFLLLFGGIIIGSWGTSIVSNALSESAVASQSQYSVYDAINWLGSHTPNNSQYLSVSDWRFTYSNLMIGRVTYYSYQSLPTNAIVAAKNLSASYIIVTNITTLSLAPIPDLYPWNNFPTASNSNLTLVYQNDDVRIFEIANFT